MKKNLTTALLSCLVAANQHQVLSLSGRFETLQDRVGACVSDSDIACSPAACPVLAKATAKRPGSNRTTFPRNAMRTCRFASRGSDRRKSTTLTSIPTGRPCTERNSAPPAETSTVLSKNILFPLSPAAVMTAAGRSRVSRLCFLMDQTVTGADRSAPPWQEKVPSPSCRQTYSAMRTLQGEVIKGNTSRLRYFYGKRLVAGA